MCESSSKRVTKRVPWLHLPKRVPRLHLPKRVPWLHLPKRVHRLHLPKRVHEEWKAHRFCAYVHMHPRP